MEKWPKLYTKLCQGHIFVCPNSAIISSQISFRFRGKVVYYLRCMSPSEFLMSMLSIVQDLRSKGGSNNWGFWLFNRQVANTLAAFSFYFPKVRFDRLNDLPFIWNSYKFEILQSCTEDMLRWMNQHLLHISRIQKFLNLSNRLPKLPVFFSKTQFHRIIFPTLSALWSAIDGFH